MFFQQNIDHAIADSSDSAWQDAQAKASAALKQLQGQYNNRTLPFLHLPEDDESITAIAEKAQEILNGGCKYVVLVGTGGSSFGANTLAALPRKDRDNFPKFYVLDNADPATAQRVYDRIDAASTVFMLISKSGNTVEVLTHSVMALSFMQQNLPDGTALTPHFYVITEPKQSPLRELAEHHKLSIIDHDPDLGGRYSVLSIVGLLPAACVGVDIVAICRGARSALEQSMHAKNIDDSNAALGAALGAYHYHQGRQIAPFMPYCDHLREFGHWYKQLISESLGKENIGITPLTARGAVDQHSMLQLFLDGPDDKWFTLVIGKQAGDGLPITTELETLSYLNNHTIGDVLESLQQGTIQTLIHNNRPVRVIRLQDYVSAEALGALLMHWMLEVVLLADILNINPYDQPAVEQGKKLARDYLRQLS